MDSGIFVHPTAEVSEKASIGEGTKIWHGCHIRENAKIGTHCVLSKDVYIDQDVQIGNRVKIQNGVSVYKGVTIEDDAFLGPHCVFTNDLRPRSSSTSWKIIPTQIRKGASVGAGSVIVCGVDLGSYCMVGAGTVVTKSIPPHALVVGNPGKIVGYVCVCGQKLETQGIPRDIFLCPACKVRD